MVPEGSCNKFLVLVPLRSPPLGWEDLGLGLAAFGGDFPQLQNPTVQNNDENRSHK